MRLRRVAGAGGYRSLALRFDLISLIVPRGYPMFAGGAIPCEQRLA
jgi:hypothetical protein